jgi:hypothetical protein
VIPDPNERPLLTVDELLEAVPAWPGGRSATYEAIRRGELPSVRIGRRLFLCTGTLRKLLGLDDARAGPVTRNGAPDPTKAPPESPQLAALSPERREDE